MFFNRSEEYMGLFPAASLTGVCIGSAALLVLAGELAQAKGFEAIALSLFCGLSMLFVAHHFWCGLKKVVSGIFVKFRMKRPNTETMGNAIPDIILAVLGLLLVIIGAIGVLFITISARPQLSAGSMSIGALGFAIFTVGIAVFTMGIAVFTITIAWAIRLSLTDYGLPDRMRERRLDSIK